MSIKNEETPLMAFRVEYATLAPQLITQGIIIPKVGFTDAELKDIQSGSAVSPVNIFWDTGATCSLVKPDIADKFGVRTQKVSEASLGGIGGTRKVDICIAGMLILPNGLQIKPFQFCVADFGSTADVLIGMDIILHGDLTISNFGQKTVFCFSCPPHSNPHSLDLKARADAKNPAIIKRMHKK